MHQISPKWIQDLAWLGWECDSLGIEKKLKVEHTSKWYVHTSESDNEILNYKWTI